MHVLYPILIGIATAMKTADAITTYIAIYVKKNSVEGDQAWFAQWTAAAPWRLLVIVPLLAPAIGLAGYLLRPYGEYAALAGSFAFGITGLIAAIHNIKVAHE